MTLLAPAAGVELRAAAFGADGPLDEAGRRALAGVRAPAARRALTGPSPRCRETAAGLGLAAAADDRLADWDMGRWRGRTLDEVSAAEPEAVTAWLADPDAAPHGGESLHALLTRVGGWLDGADGRPDGTDGAHGAGAEGGRTIAVAEVAVIRAALVHALQLPPEVFWRLDVPPLTATELSGRAGRWNLRCGRPLTA
ncbi:histidine phosphatase family protein [Streptomyces sp. A7024]|uniref:Histidine phosphatase family protein n=1 Tax=Streptomyces coryli TaxID=1128680 RepID=A0A6G4U5X6_9ACTN|nr:histidine phosphatase family protein [Streptomyces coryli]NGN66601.1 histidine phosphatase family protein [Streptomyces coryli]